jgi:hypothetical protein
MSLWVGSLIGIGIFLVVYALFVLVLVIAGRRESAWRHSATSQTSLRASRQRPHLARSSWTPKRTTLSPLCIPLSSGANSN